MMNGFGEMGHQQQLKWLDEWLMTISLELGFFLHAITFIQTLNKEDVQI